MKIIESFIKLFALLLFISACSTPPTPAATQTPEPTITPIPQTFKVTFIAFHDYDGNGKQDSEEPLLQGINISTLTGQCTTNNQGTCEIFNHPGGSTVLSITDKREIGQGAKLGFILPSISNSIPLSAGIKVDISKDEILTIPLGQGSCLLPFPKDVMYDIYTYFDSDKRDFFVGNWKGETDNPKKTGSNFYSYKIRVEDRHYAIDFIFNESVPILASDAGIVSIITKDKNQSNPDDYFINIETKAGFHLDYGHVKPVDTLKSGAYVNRGQLIGHAVIHNVNSYFKPPVYMVHIGFFPKDSNQALDPYLSNWIVFKSDISRASQ